MDLTQDSSQKPASCAYRLTVFPSAIQDSIPGPYALCTLTTDPQVNNKRAAPIGQGFHRRQSSQSAHAKAQPSSSQFAQAACQCHPRHSIRSMRERGTALVADVLVAGASYALSGAQSADCRCSVWFASCRDSRNVTWKSWLAL